MLWTPVAAASSHANIAIFLAGFSVTFLGLFLAPLASGDRSDAFEDLEEHVVRSLLVAFAVLTVAAVEWSALYGYSDSLPATTCKTIRNLEQCEITGVGRPTTAVIALACVLLLCMGALLFFASVAEAASLILAVRRKKELGETPSDSQIADVERRHRRVVSSSRRIFVFLALLSTWEIGYFALDAMSAVFGWTTNDNVDIALVAVLAGAVTLTWLLARWAAVVPSLALWTSQYEGGWIAKWINARRLAGIAATLAVACAVLVPEVGASQTADYTDWTWRLSLLLGLVATGLTAIVVVGIMLSLGGTSLRTLERLGYVPNKERKMWEKRWAYQRVKAHVNAAQQATEGAGRAEAASLQMKGGRLPDAELGTIGDPPSPQ